MRFIVLSEERRTEDSGIGKDVQSLSDNDLQPVRCVGVGKPCRSLKLRRIGMCENCPETSESIRFETEKNKTDSGRKTRSGRI